LQPEQRRLAAILAADVAGYSRLMAADEVGTLACLNQLRAEVIEPKISQFGGRVVGSAGDSLLIEFTSAVNAVECAVQMQSALAAQNSKLPDDRRMEFRMGINLGDIIAEADTIFGDGVNIAARLEKLAEPGGVCIGRSVYDQIKGKLPLAYSDLGAQQVRNIPEPIHAYRVQLSASIATSRQTLDLPDKPSIAVLPFENMSGDSEQEYFADGMVEDITTALSRMRWLFVIARNSSFTYKGQAIDVKRVGRELGVRYVLQGSVRKAGSRVRITGQLIDASTGAHLWADRFDGKLKDVFDLQDQVTTSVIGAIAPKLEQAEIERASRKLTESLGAYDYFLRGMAAFHKYTKEANNEALVLFSRAIEIDPNFASAHAMSARCYLQRRGYGWVTDHAREVGETARLARRAADLGREDADALSSAGLALAVVVGDLDDGAALIDRALTLNANLTWAWLSSGFVKAFIGEAETAINHAARAMRLSPHDPQMFAMLTATAFGHFLAGRNVEALSWAEAAVRELPVFVMANCVVAASSALAGKPEEAAKAMAHVRQLNPTLRLTNLKDLAPIRRSVDFNRWSEGLRRAGLPE